VNSNSNESEDVEYLKNSVRDGLGGGDGPDGEDEEQFNWRAGRAHERACFRISLAILKKAPAKANPAPDGALPGAPSVGPGGFSLASLFLSVYSDTNLMAAINMLKQAGCKLICRPLP